MYDERRKLKDKGRIWFDQTDELNELLEWMNELRNVLSSCKVMKLDSEAFKRQLDGFEVSQTIKDLKKTFYLHYNSKQTYLCNEQTAKRRRFPNEG